MDVERYYGPINDEDSARMTSTQIIRGSDILNTPVIAGNNAKRLGVFTQVWADLDRREVVALSLRDSPLSISGVPRYVLLGNILKIDDVILVDDENAIEDIDVEVNSSLINSEVITETGELLGRVRDFRFFRDTGKIYSLQIAALGLPQIPEQIVSTYELPSQEIISSGPNRLIVFEGAQERLRQLSVGILERLGIYKPQWQRNKKDMVTSYSQGSRRDDWWEEDDDDTEGSSPMTRPRRPKPGSRPNDTAQQPDEAFNDKDIWADAGYIDVEARAKLGDKPMEI